MHDWRSLWESVGATERPFAPEARLGVIGMMVLACVALATVHTLKPTPRLVWNASASAPVGLYSVRPIDRLEVGDLVLAWLPDEARALAAERLYLPLNTPGVKRVAALAGDVVCVRNGVVLINEGVAAIVLERDSRGRKLTPWWGCRALLPREVFLLNTDSPASFDGRYFGPSRVRDVVGKLAPLWTF